MDRQSLYVHAACVLTRFRAQNWHPISHVLYSRMCYVELELKVMVCKASKGFLTRLQRLCFTDLWAAGCSIWTYAWDTILKFALYSMDWLCSFCKIYSICDFVFNRAMGANLEIERLQLPKFYHYFHERSSDWYENARIWVFCDRILLDVSFESLKNY